MTNGGFGHTEANSARRCPLSAVDGRHLIRGLDSIFAGRLIGICVGADQRPQSRKDSANLWPMTWKVIMVELEQVGGFGRATADRPRKILSNFSGPNQGLALVGKDEANPAVAWGLQQKCAVAGTVEQKVAAADQVQLVTRRDAARVQQIACPRTGSIHHPV